MNKNFGWAYSSANPEKISLTLKSLVPLIIFGLGAFGYYNITDNDLYGGIESIIAIFSAVGVFYGIARKIYYKFQ